MIFFVRPKFWKTMEDEGEEDWYKTSGELPIPAQTHTHTCNERERDRERDRERQTTCVKSGTHKCCCTDSRAHPPPPPLASKKMWLQTTTTTTSTKLIKQTIFFSLSISLSTLMCMFVLLPFPSSQILGRSERATLTSCFAHTLTCNYPIP